MRFGGRRGSFVLAAIAAVSLYPTVARAPQSGDGVELVRVALQGGVPHPTGFPLQAWLDRLAVLLPLGTPAYRLALLGLLAHAATVYVASETLRRLDVTSIGRSFAAAAFALFPPVWALAVAPEVFAIAHLIVAASLLHVAVLAGRAPGAVDARDGTVLGALAGLATAQHPITIEAVPAFAVGFALVARDRNGRWLRCASTVGVGAAIALGFFASLPLLRSDSPWPDWGHLSGASAILRHALRKEYGMTALSGAATGPTLDGLEVFGHDLAVHGGVTVIAALSGSVLWLRRRERRLFLASTLGVIAAGLVVLGRATMPDELMSLGYLSKLDGPIVLGLALLGGAGVDALAGGPGGIRRRRAGVAAAVAVYAVASFAGGRAYADASRDDTLDVLAPALGVGLPADAVYLAENDVESFLGASTPTGTRYPIAAGLLERAWYVDSVLPRIEPRLQLTGVTDPTPDDVAGEALSRGFSVAGSSRDLAEVPGASATLSGLFYIARPIPADEFSAETVRGAVALCPLLRQLPSLPARGHVFSRHFFHRFARAYGGAATYLERRGDVEAAAAARAAERALVAGRDPAAWIAACDALAGAALDDP